jgi:hypothetical protein
MFHEPLGRNLVLCGKHPMKTSMGLRSRVSGVTALNLS